MEHILEVVVIGNKLIIILLFTQAFLAEADTHCYWKAWPNTRNRAAKK
jgi:hypothetical protein